MIKLITKDMVWRINDTKGLNDILNSCKMVGNINAKIIIVISPAWFWFKKYCILGLSDQPNNILDPSNGGIGSKLKAANIMLNSSMLKQKYAKIPLIIFSGNKNVSFSNNSEIMAKIMLAAIPEIAIRTMSFLGEIKDL